MTVREFTEMIASFPAYKVLLFFTVPPLVSFLAGILHGKGKGNASPWKYIYSVLIYWVCVPGIFSAVMTLYTIFFTGENLLDQNILIYILPVVSMVVSLVFINKNVSFDDIPGFDRIYGLMIIIAIVFAMVLIVHKTRLWVFFGGSIFLLVFFIIILLAVLEWGAHLLFKKKI